MEITLSCFNCSYSIPEKPTYYFCQKCLTQVKCKNCSELIEKDAEKRSENKAVNTIEFEQKGNNKKFVASFTDHVGENLVASLGGLFLGTNSFKTNQNPFVQIKGAQPIPVSGKKEIPAAEYAQVIEADENDVNAALTKIFRTEEDKVILINQRLKQSGKRDHSIRITLVLLYAYSLIGKPRIKRNMIAEVLQSAAVYDNNFLTWLGKCDEIKKTDDELELNLPGKDAAIEILKEFLNPSIEKGKVHFSAISTSTGKKGRSKKSKTEGATEAPTGKTGSTNSRVSPAKMIDILIAEKYFSDKKRIPEIVKYCKDIKGQTLETSTLSVAMLRKIKSGILKREQNSADNQYDYYQ
jgi:hypothetical protein